jgi:hypothetical protein
MKIVLRSVLTLSLATSVLLATPLLCAATDASSDKTTSTQGSTAVEAFPLNKHNGIRLHIQTIPGTGDKTSVRYSLYPTFVGGDKALQEVIAHPESANALELATAAAGALRSGDLEEAGFLIFAAQLREAQDLESYPPAQNGEKVNTRTWVGMVVGGVRADVVTGELQYQPKVVARVVKRLEGLQLKETAGYKPGWDYVKHTAMPGLFVKNKASLLSELKPTSALLLTPDYFAAFKCYCEINDLSPEKQQSPGNAKKRAQAVATMKRIEKEKNLQGIMYQVDHAEVN